MAVYTFLVRLYFYDNDTLDDVVEQLARDMNCDRPMETLHSGFYNLFYEGFCDKPNRREIPFPNLHVFYHAYLSRKKSGRPWHETSTEAFEAKFANIPRFCKPGTRNIPKQILENSYVAMG